MASSSESELRPSASRIARSALLVIGLLAFAKVFSLAEKWVGLDRYGISTAWDTFAAANQIPEQLFNLIAGGALAHAFIPIFAEMLDHDDREGAWRLASNVLNTILLTVLIASIVVFLLAPWLIGTLLAPGFKYMDLSNPLHVDTIASFLRINPVMQTAYLMRILLLSLMIFSVSGMSMGILQTHQRFLLPALAPILFDVGNLFGTLVLFKFMGVYGTAVGAVIGAGLHLGIQLPGLWRLKAKWRPLLNWRDPALRQVITLMIPRAMGLFLFNFNAFVATRLASNVGEGSVAAYNRGYTLMQLPETLIGTAMGIVIFPTLAVLSSSGDLRGKRSAMSGALRFILIASIPAALAMVLTGRVLVGVLIGGEFDAIGAERVLRVLQFFAIGIVTQSASEILTRSFYADRDTMTPLATALVTAIVNLVLAVAFVEVFSVAGLALANSLAVGVEVVILTLILRHRWQGIDESALATTVVKTALATLVMGIVLAVVDSAANRIIPINGSRLMLIVRAGLELGIAGVTYLGAALVLRIDEIRELPRLIMKRRAAVVAVEAPGD